MRYELKSQTPRAVGWFLVKQAEISYNARSERAGRSQTQGTRRQSRLPLVVFKRAIVPRSVPRSCSIKLASLHSYLYSPHSGHRSLTWSQNGVDSCDAYIRARLVLYVYIYIYIRIVFSSCIYECKLHEWRTRKRLVRMSQRRRSAYRVDKENK